MRPRGSTPRRSATAARAHQGGERAVVDGAGVGGRHGAVGGEGRLQRCQRLRGRVGAQRLVALDPLDLHDEAVVLAGVVGRGHPLVGAHRPGVLLVAADAQLGRQPARRRRRGSRSSARGTSGWPCASRPWSGAAASTRGSASSGFGQHVGRPAHALDAAGDDEVGVAGGDGAARLHHGLAARGAQPVDRDTRHADGQAGEQRGHAGDVAVLLAGAVGVAVVDVLDRRGVEAGVPGDELGDRQGREVVGADARQAAAVAAEGRAHGIDDVGVA